MSEKISIFKVLSAWEKILREKDLHSVLFTYKLFHEEKLCSEDIKQILNEHGYFLDNPIITDKFDGENTLERAFLTRRAKTLLSDIVYEVLNDKFNDALNKRTLCKFSVWDCADCEYTTEEEKGEIFKTSSGKIILLSNFIGFLGEIYTHKAKTEKLKTVYDIKDFNPIHYNYGLDIDFKDWNFAHIIDGYHIQLGEIVSRYECPPQILTIEF